MLESSVCSVEKISETFLIPVLEELLTAFPFKLQGFHSDNGSEYINYNVANLLDSFHINSQNPDHEKQTTMHLLNLKTVLLSEKYWVMLIYLSTMLRKSMRFS